MKGTRLFIITQVTFITGIFTQIYPMKVKSSYLSPSLLFNYNLLCKYSENVLKQSEIFYLRQFVLNLSNFINISNKYTKLFFLT